MESKTDQEIKVASSESPINFAEGKMTIIQDKRLDDAEIFLREHNYTWDRAEELLSDKQKYGALKKKVDWNLMPLMMVTYGLQLVDKNTMAYGAVFDLRSEANLKGQEYAWLGSVFYFGYLFWEYPGSFIAQRFSVGRYVSIVVIIWGAVLMLTAAAQSFGSLVACRFILGCLEAPITPCFMMIVGTWYERQGQPLRAGLFYMCNGIGSIVGSLLFFAVGQTTKFPVYKAIFLLAGGLTVVWGLVLLWRLPSSVIKAKHYSVEEKVMIMGISRRNQTGFSNHHIKMYQIFEAFRDPQLWLCFIMMVCNEVVNGGFVTFGSLIIRSLVDTALEATALGIPQGAFTTVFIISGTYIASRFNNCRCYVMAIWVLPSVLASFLYLYLPRSHIVGLLFAYYIMSAYCATLTLVLQMPTYNVAGYTKRVTGTAFVFIGYCVGNIIGPHAFVSTEAPEYPSGSKTLIVCNAVQIGFAFALRWLLVRRNRKRDALQASQPTEITSEDQALYDKTDFEDLSFRYKY